MAREDGTKLVGFQRGSTEPGKRYSKFLKNNSVQISDTQSIDELEKAIQKLFRRFNPVFDLLAPVLKEFEYFSVSERVRG
ncbi:hypothetical protein [Rhizobium wenxiniae]|uniref:hypothetical protein n=1 Tax=Rhizobium wenxiniae TaxID=1737357 RepID=UPI003C22CCBA